MARRGRKSDSGKAGVVYIFGGVALIFAAFLTYLVAPAIYKLRCPVSGGFYGGGACSFGDSLMSTIMAYALIVVVLAAGFVLICVGVVKNVRAK